MNACYANLRNLSRRELERVASGEGEYDECMVVGAPLVLAERDAVEAWRSSFTGSTPERLRRWKVVEQTRKALEEELV